MTLGELMRVLPAYCNVCVHDTRTSHAYAGNPHQFANGIFRMNADHTVKIACPLSSYTIEVTVEEDLK